MIYFMICHSQPLVYIEGIVKVCLMPFSTQVYCQRNIHLGIICLPSPTPEPMISQPSIIPKSPALQLSPKCAYFRCVYSSSTDRC